MIVFMLIMIVENVKPSFFLAKVMPIVKFRKMYTKKDKSICLNPQNRKVFFHH